MSAVEILRAGLLAGVRVGVAGEGELGRAVSSRLDELGAITQGDDVDVLVWDGAAAFSSAPGVEGVRAALDGAWLAVRPVALSWIEHDRGGLIVLLAPPPGDAHAEAARAGLENLARTLSIEWSRFAIRPVAILPGERTPPGEVAELAGYLASRAGAYFSGCAFTLGAA